MILMNNWFTENRSSKNPWKWCGFCKNVHCLSEVPYPKRIKTQGCGLTNYSIMPSTSSAHFQKVPFKEESNKKLIKRIRSTAQKLFLAPIQIRYLFRFCLFIEWWSTRNKSSNYYQIIWFGQAQNSVSINFMILNPGGVGGAVKILIQQGLGLDLKKGLKLTTTSKFRV